jgi:GAF domain-containing protein
VFPIFDLVEAVGTLGSRVSRIHAYLKSVPQTEAVSRISLAVFDSVSGVIQTLAFSNNSSVDVDNISVRLDEVPSLGALAHSRSYRIIDDIAASYNGERDHSAEIINSGVRSSLTFPVRRLGRLVGFVFVNSNQPAYFTPERVEFLCPFATILSLSLIEELPRLAHEAAKSPAGTA